MSEMPADIRATVRGLFQIGSPPWLDGPICDAILAERERNAPLIQALAPFAVVAQKHAELGSTIEEAMRAALLTEFDFQQADIACRAFAKVSA